MLCWILKQVQYALFFHEVVFPERVAACQGAARRGWKVCLCRHPRVLLSGMTITFGCYCHFQREMSCSVLVLIVIPESCSRESVVCRCRHPGKAQSRICCYKTRLRFQNTPRRVLVGRLLPSGITLFLIVIPGVDPGSSLFIRKTPYFISGFQVPACMRALE